MKYIPWTIWNNKAFFLSSTAKLDSRETAVDQSISYVSQCLGSANGRREGRCNIGHSPFWAVCQDAALIVKRVTEKDWPVKRFLTTEAMTLACSMDPGLTDVLAHDVLPALRLSDLQAIRNTSTAYRAVVEGLAPATWLRVAR